MDDFRLDRTQFSVAHLTDPDDAVEYWLSRPVEERLRELEHLRRICYGASASQEIQRVLEVVQLDSHYNPGPSVAQSEREALAPTILTE